MAEPYVGEIIMFAGSYVPLGWQACDGSLLAISQYSTLYNLLGITYGGDGQTTFGVPDLRGRVPVHQGQGVGLTSYAMGQSSGSETVTLVSNQIASHSHPLLVASGPGDTEIPSAGTVLASLGPAGNAQTNAYGPYNAATQVPLNATSVAPQSATQPHNNIQPTLAVRFIISTEGIFPSPP